MGERTKDEFTEDPGQLANEIDDALRQYGLGSNERLFQSIRFFEGELRMISRALRTVATAPPPFMMGRRRR